MGSDPVAKRFGIAFVAIVEPVLPQAADQNEAVEYVTIATLLERKTISIQRVAKLPLYGADDGRDIGRESATVTPTLRVAYRYWTAGRMTPRHSPKPIEA